jgi:uncharacterized protein (TIGR03437 family)
VYALADFLYRSDNGGRSWTNLTAFHDLSIIGAGQHALAASPADPEQVVVANDQGVWRSMDGGLSWTGLNQYLPNLPVRRILATPAGATGTRIVADGLGVLELGPGDQVWKPAAAGDAQQVSGLRREYGAAIGAEISATAGSGDLVYAGSSDGRIWVSFDRGRSWQPSQPAAGANPVESIWADAAQPRVALAAMGGGAGAHLLRTTNSGVTWTDITADLGDAPAHGVTADRASGAVYVATDSGVFYAREDLDSSGPAVPWTRLTANLPRATATDVILGAGGNQLYIALDGYGVYAVAAPHRENQLRLVNAADFSNRAAAPGSLVSVLGGRIAAAASGTLNFPVLAASDKESQLQVPFEASPSTAALALNTAGSTVTLGLPVLAVSPAIFVGRDGAPMLLDADSGLVLDARNAARSNARIQVWATGLGKVRPDWPTGLAAPLENPPSVIADVKAYLDRTPVPVTRAVLAPGYIGFYLIELQLPALVNAGPAELYISAGGQDSNRVQIYIEP